MDVEIQILNEIRRYWIHAGILYIVRSPSWPKGILKIGKTTAPKQRLCNYNACNPYPVEVVHSWLMKNINIAEHRMKLDLAPHALIVPNRLKPRQEFFQVPVQQVTDIFHRRFAPCAPCHNQATYQAWTLRSSADTDKAKGWSKREEHEWLQRAITVCIKEEKEEKKGGSWLVLSPEEKLKLSQRIATSKKRLAAKIASSTSTSLTTTTTALALKRSKSIPSCLPHELEIPKGICYSRAAHSWVVQKQLGHSRIKPRFFVFGKGASTERILAELEKAKDFLLQLENGANCSWLKPKVVLPENLPLVKGIWWSPYENAFRIHLTACGEPMYNKIPISLFGGDWHRALEKAKQIHAEYLQKLHPSIKKSRLAFKKKLLLKEK